MSAASASGAHQCMRPDTGVAEPDRAADAVRDAKRAAGGDQREVAVALADLIEGVALALGLGREAHLGEQLVGAHRGLERALEEVACA